MDIILVPALVLLGALVGASVLSAGLQRGSALLLFLFIFSAFSGYLNNRFNRHPAIHVTRVVLLAVVCLVWLAGRRSSTRPDDLHTPLDQPLLVYLGFYLLQIFNPNWSSVKVGLLNGCLGVAQHVLPAMLFFVARDFTRTARQVARFYQLIAALSTVMAVYGIYQWVQGWDYVVSLGEGFRETVGREHLWTDDGQDVLRPVSFAQDAGAAAAYYFVGILVACALLLRPGGTKTTRVVLGAAIVVQFYSLSLTLVRSTMAGTLFGLALMLLFHGYRLRVFLPLAAAGCVFLYMGDHDTSYIAQRYRTLTVPTEIVRSRGMQIRAIWWSVANFPLGMGVGRAGPAGGRFNQPSDSRYSVPPESLFVSVTFETGVIGLLLLLRVILVLARSCWRATRLVRDPELRPLALCAVITILPIMLISFVGPTLYSAPLCYVFWFFAGMLYRLFDLERAVRAATPPRLVPTPSP